MWHCLERLTKMSVERAQNMKDDDDMVFTEMRFGVISSDPTSEELNRGME